MIQNIYQKPIANIILNGEKLGVFSLRSETRQGCPLFLFNITLEDLANAVRQEKKRKDILIGKEERKLPLFTGDVILHVENLLKITHKKPLKLISD